MSLELVRDGSIEELDLVYFGLDPAQVKLGQE